MNDENDWIMRQVNSFAEGLGYVLSRGKGSSQSEVVFPQKQTDTLPYQKEIKSLIDDHKYSLAANKILKVQYAMSEQQFILLGKWFYGTLNADKSDEIYASEISRDAMIAGLTKLSESEL